MSFTLFWYFETDGKAHIKHFGNPIPGPAVPPPPRNTQRGYLKGKHLCTFGWELNWLGFFCDTSFLFERASCDYSDLTILYLEDNFLQMNAVSLSLPGQVTTFLTIEFPSEKGSLGKCVSAAQSWTASQTWKASDEISECKWVCFKMWYNESVNIRKIVWLSEQCFPRDQCKMLQSHSWVKGPLDV